MDKAVVYKKRLIGKAKKLLEAGYSVDEVVEETGLSKEEVELAKRFSVNNNKNILNKIKDNKKELFILFGSASMLALGMYLILIDAKVSIALKNGIIENFMKHGKAMGFNELQNKEIVDIFGTVEYADGEIGLLDVENLKKAIEKL